MSGLAERVAALHRERCVDAWFTGDDDGDELGDRGWPRRRSDDQGPEWWAAIAAQLPDKVGWKEAQAAWIEHQAQQQEQARQPRRKRQRTGGRRPQYLVPPRQAGRPAASAADSSDAPGGRWSNAQLKDFLLFCDVDSSGILERAELLARVQALLRQREAGSGSGSGSSSAKAGCGEGQGYRPPRPPPVPPRASRAAGDGSPPPEEHPEPSQGSSAGAGSRGAARGPREGESARRSNTSWDYAGCDYTGYGAASPPPPESPPPQQPPPRSNRSSQQQEQQRQQQQDRRQPRDRRWARRLLGVQPSDPPATIRKRYHALARRWHPDKVSATTTAASGSDGSKVGASETAKATAMFQQVQAAYEILS